MRWSEDADSAFVGQCCPGVLRLFTLLLPVAFARWLGFGGSAAESRGAPRPGGSEYTPDLAAAQDSEGEMFNCGCLSSNLHAHVMRPAVPGHYHEQDVVQPVTLHGFHEIVEAGEPQLVDFEDHISLLQTEFPGGAVAAH